MQLPQLLLPLLAAVATLGTAYTGPPISATIQAAWSSPPLVTQYLETLALEAPTRLFPFLDFLASKPNICQTLRHPLSPASFNLVQQYEHAGVNPAFAPHGALQPNETYAILQLAAERSLLLRSRGLRESIQLSLANRHTSVRIEGTRKIWEDRERQVQEWEKTRLVEQGEHERETIQLERKMEPLVHRALCESWVDVGGKKVCSVEEFWLVVGSEQKSETSPISLPDSLPSLDRPTLYPVDHISPQGDQRHLPRVVLYGSPSSPSFQSLYTFLRSLSEPKAVPTTDLKASTSRLANGLPIAKNLAAPHPPRLQFILRWKPETTGGKGEKLVLTGYGAALDIKKSDYLAIDDRLTGVHAGSALSNASEPLLEIEGDVAPKMEPVKKSEVPELSLRSAQFILNSKEPFKAFSTLTSSFPRLASHLSTLVPDPHPHLLSEVSTNQMSSPTLTMRPAFFLNGLELSEADIDPFALIRLMRKERQYLKDLVGLDKHMAGQDARRILIDGSPKSKSGGAGGRKGLIDAEALGELYDATDRSEGGKVISWWNDLEKDRRYKSWSKSVKDLLRPTYPGSMSLIARNLNNVIFILDLSQPNAVALITEDVKQFVSRGIPVRFGIVPLVADDEEAVETQVAQVLWYLVDALGRMPAMNFLSDLQLASPTFPITPELLRKFYSRIAATQPHVEGGPLASYEEIQRGVGQKATSAQSRLSKTREYLRRLGIQLATGQAEGKTSLGSFITNGAYNPIDEEFSQNLQRTLGLHTQFLQQEVYLGKLDGKVDAKTYFADLPSTHKRRNPYIFPAVETNPLRFVNLVEAFEGIDEGFALEGYVEGVTGEINETTGFDVEEAPAPATIFVVTDLNAPEGINLARAALKLVDTDTRARVSFIHNPYDSFEEAHPWALSNLLYLLHRDRRFEDVLPVEVINWIDLDLDPSGPQSDHGQGWTAENPLKAALGQGVTGKTAAEAEMFWEELRFFGYKLGFQSGESGVVINGRVIGPIPDGAFDFADLRTLLSYELDKRIDNVVTAVNATSLDLDLLTRQQRSHLINVASSIVGVASLPDPTQGIFGGIPAERRRDYLALAGNHSAVIDQRDRGALYEVAVIVDPATELAQRWAPILETLSHLVFVHIRLYLNPAFHLDDIPIKRFYEFSFLPSLRFDEAGQEIRPGVSFENIPEDLLLTFSADVHKSWLAFPKTSVHDLDNIRLADLPSAHKKEGVNAVFELEALVVEGHARDMPSSKPPRGLQLELRRGGINGSEEHTVDTVVAANLGYFQFKANPGSWRLAIRPGLSSRVFEVESVGANGWKSGEVSQTGDELFVSTLEGLTLYPRFRRKVGHERTELLDESAAAAAHGKDEGSFVDRIRNMIPFFAAPSKELTVGTKTADINVFTVASGLLYERMAFLMMVSVMRHTKSTVKFWFIQNFLSPSFKAFIPHLAQEYGFDYELVTYKWPHWLRAQKEKQRTIWGYKILFLDVLFPLELDRVIFVDSDQIVRTDLKELIDMDLNGAPYAFAPMGNDRPEMEGFRFWNSGYWKNHLQGKPYHISALYLVDLDRFRQIAAGDRLRQQYQGLSADPHSLANLDQDLPNNMQNMIPIHTLDKSWLWCETWCSDEGLATAKTIDLCNNPLTKEEKLKRAKRLIPEWTAYDDEVSALARRIAEESSDAGAFVAKADELEQAVQQQKEREEHVEEIQAGGGGGPGQGEEKGHVKDEL